MTRHSTTRHPTTRRPAHAPTTAALVPALLATLLTALLAVSTTAAPSHAAAPTCPGQSPATTDLDGLAGTAQPVILVHGWTGEAMRATRNKLHEFASRTRRQYLLFDYKSHNTEWASHPAIAACLADYIRKVSKAHSDDGGNGRVFLAAHSMGGIAIRFALDPTYGGVPPLLDKVGGVVTIDTPHTGTIWGASDAAMIISALQGTPTKDRPATAAALPPPQAKAWTCLAGGPKATFAGCAVPPPMPASVPLRQLVGEVSVRRTLFGHEAYTMNFGGDVIVPSTSQWGGGPDFRTVACTTTGVDLGVSGWLQLHADSTALNIFSGASKANLGGFVDALEPLLQGLMRSSCSHAGMPTDPKAMTLLDQALDEQARNAGVTLRQLREPAPIPASCTHPASTVTGGERAFPGNTGSAYLNLSPDTDFQAGPVFADLTGEGSREGIVIMGCNAGGVSWPDWLLIYGQGPKLLAAISLADLSTTQEHATISSIDVDGDTVKLQWSSYDGAGFNVRYLTGTVRRTGAGFELTDVAPEQPRYTIGPGTFADLTVGDTAADLQQRGWATPNTSGMCNQRWDLDAPPGILGDFRTGDPDTLDYIGVISSAPSETLRTVRTAEGIGAGTSVRDVLDTYGEDLPLITGIQGEGDAFAALVLNGTDGTLLITVHNDFHDPVVAREDLELAEVSGLFAIGPDPAAFGIVAGGC